MRQSFKTIYLNIFDTLRKGCVLAKFKIKEQNIKYFKNNTWKKVIKKRYDLSCGDSKNRSQISPALLMQGYVKIFVENSPEICRACA
jgi:hypothetical protein